MTTTNDPGWAALLVRDIRSRLGLSQRELAEAAGMHQPDIAQIESGRRRATFDTVDRILAAVGHEMRIRIAPADDHDQVLAQIVARDPDRARDRLAAAHAAFDGAAR